MPSRRPIRSKRTGSRAFVVLAVLVVGLLVAGSVAALFSSLRDSDEDSTGENPEVLITPGEEVARLETVIADHPDDALSMGLLAEVLANSGRVNEAIPWYERAVELRPDDVSFRIAFGRALQRNQNTFDAEVQFKRALEIEPNHQTAAFYLASLYEGLPQPRLDDAIAMYQRSIEADPTSVIAGQARDRLADLGVVSASPTSGP